MSRLTPEIVSHAFALAVTFALAGVIFMRTSVVTMPVSLTHPAIQIALEPAPVTPEPAPALPVEQPRPPPPRPLPRHEHHEAKALPMMAALTPPSVETAATPAAEGENAQDAGVGTVGDAAPRLAAVSSGTLEAQYAATLRTNIDSRTSVPNTVEYRLRKPRGEARVSFTLDRAGSMLETALAKSSGSGLLDRQAMNIVQTGRYPPFPDAAFRGESRHSFVVTLEFKL